MPSASREHDSAWETTAAVVTVFAPLLREEEIVEALHKVYACIRKAFRDHEERAARPRRRLGEK